MDFSLLSFWDVYSYSYPSCIDSNPKWVGVDIDGIDYVTEIGNAHMRRILRDVCRTVKVFLTYVGA